MQFQRRRHQLLAEQRCCYHRGLWWALGFANALLVLAASAVYLLPAGTTGPTAMFVGGTYRCTGLLLHVLFESDFLWADTRGSWIDAGLRDGWLECPELGRFLVPSTFAASRARPLAPSAAVAKGAREVVFLSLGCRPGGSLQSAWPWRSARVVEGADASLNHAGGGRRLDEVLGLFRPRAAVVVAYSTCPQATTALVAHISAQLSLAGVRPARAVVLHYAAHRLADPMDGGVHPAAVRPDGPHLAAEIFWNTFWDRLQRRAALAAAEEARIVGADAPLSWRGGGREASRGGGGGGDHAADLAAWCAASGARHSGAAAGAGWPSGSNTFLLLGGDAHTHRAQVVLHLFERGLLDGALWSLSTPAFCERPAPRRDEAPVAQAALRPHLLRLSGGGGGEQLLSSFCAEFPKTLDRQLGGAQEVSNKDLTFAPPELYADTAFSLVFESLVCCDGDRVETALTEKVLKPALFGHAFVLACAGPGALRVLRSFGFRTDFFIFGGDDDDDGDVEFLYSWWTRRPGCNSNRVVDRVAKVVRLGPAALGELRRGAAVVHNQRHMVCPGGLRATLTEHAHAVLSFVDRVNHGGAAGG